MKTQMLNNVTNTVNRKSRSQAATRMASIAAAVVLALAGAAAAQAQANLVVRVNNAVQATNQEFVFPDTPVGESSEMVIVIRNEGNQTLTFTENPAVTLAGGFPESFEVVQPALETGASLSPNGSSAFLVRIKPQFRFARLFTHAYLWTDASATPFHMIFSGRATAPDMFVHVDGLEIPDGDVLVFPDTEIGQTSSVTLTIENLGDADLVLTGDPLAQIFGGFGFDFAVDQQPDTTIAANGSTQARISFTPTLERLYTTRLFINVNQNDAVVNELYDINIEALATSPVQTNEQPGQDPSDPDEGQDDIGGEGDGGQNNQDAGDPQSADQFEDELDGLLPPSGMCGMGAGFASLMSMVSVGGAKLGSRRRRSPGISSDR